MEHPPADARAAPSASGPTDMATETPPSPKRPRDPSSDNKVCQRATSSDSVWPERQIVTTENQPTAPASACQSLAHPTTPMGRWLKSVDCWVLLCEELYRVAAQKTLRGFLMWRVPTHGWHRSPTHGRLWRLDARPCRAPISQASNDIQVRPTPAAQRAP